MADCRVVLILGRHTSFPMLEESHSAVVLGTAILTVFGAGQLVRDGYNRFSE
jgi:hypothetical protein